jgi:hypothetical protein
MKNRKRMRRVGGPEVLTLGVTLGVALGGT